MLRQTVGLFKRNWITILFGQWTQDSTHHPSFSCMLWRLTNWRPQWIVTWLLSKSALKIWHRVYSHWYSSTLELRWKALYETRNIIIIIIIIITHKMAPVMKRWRSHNFMSDCFILDISKMDSHILFFRSPSQTVWNQFRILMLLWVLSIPR